jgi:hypothetical protein
MVGVLGAEQRHFGDTLFLIRHSWLPWCYKVEDRTNLMLELEELGYLEVNQDGENGSGGCG